MLAVKTRIVKIGNSRGVRLPRVLLEQVALGEDVEVAAVRDYLVIRSARQPRAGWAERFEQLLAQKPAEAQLDKITPTRWDEEEWEW
jgi:antitoxin MazE